MKKKRRKVGEVLTPPGRDLKGNRTATKTTEASKKRGRGLLCGVTRTGHRNKSRQGATAGSQQKNQQIKGYEPCSKEKR